VFCKRPLAGSRMFFALGNAAMNPVAFGMIPELFPKRKSLATAIYNLSIHAGRAGAFLAGGMASAPLMGAYLDSDVWSFPSLLGIPLDKLNVRLLSPPLFCPERSFVADWSLTLGSQ